MSGAQGKASHGTNQSYEIGNGSRIGATIGQDAHGFRTARTGPDSLVAESRNDTS